MKIWLMNHYAIEHLYEKGGRHYWIAENLKKDGYEPVVFGCNEKHNSNGMYYPSEKLAHIVYSESGVPFVAVRSTPYMGNGISRIKNMLIFALNLIRTAKTYSTKYGKPDVIYASSVHPLTVFAGEKLARYFGVPCIGEVRDLWPETLVAYGAVKKNSILARLLYWGEKIMYKKADAMIFTMEGAPDYIREHKWDTASGGPIDLCHVYHICNGVDIEQFDKNAEEYVLPDAELDDPNLFCAVYTGAIKRANNVGLLINTAEYLKDIEDFRILIWGDGNEVEELKKKVVSKGLSGRVIFKGFVDKKYIASIVKRADICLLHWERISVNKYGYSYNKLFDYLASGRMVFSTIQSGHSLIVDKNCGIETEGRTPSCFAEEIRKIYNMPEAERLEWGRRARKIVYEYDFRVLTKKLEKILEEIVS